MGPGGRGVAGVHHGRRVRVGERIGPGVGRPERRRTRCGRPGRRCGGKRGALGVRPGSGGPLHRRQRRAKRRRFALLQSSRICAARHCASGERLDHPGSGGGGAMKGVAKHGPANRSSRGGGRSCNERGSILLEVLVSALLIGLVVGPLATALSGVIGQARAVREAGAGDAASDRTHAGRLEGWGPRVTEAAWRPGPVLTLTTDLAGSRNIVEASVGVWVNGWSVGEVTVGRRRSGSGGRRDYSRACLERTCGRGSGAAGSYRSGGLGASVALSRAGRRRGSSGTLGRLRAWSPWSPRSSSTGPVAGTSKLTVSWAAAPLPAPPFPLLFTASASVLGWGEAVLDGGSQWWWMEEGRSVDVFY